MIKKSFELEQQKNLRRGIQPNEQASFESEGAVKAADAPAMRGSTRKQFQSQRKVFPEGSASAEAVVRHRERNSTAFTTQETSRGETRTRGSNYSNLYASPTDKANQENSRGETRTGGLDHSSIYAAHANAINRENIRSETRTGGLDHSSIYAAHANAINRENIRSETRTSGSVYSNIYSSFVNEANVVSRHSMRFASQGNERSRADSSEQPAYDRFSADDGQSFRSDIPSHTEGGYETGALPENKPSHIQSNRQATLDSQPAMDGQLVYSGMVSHAAHMARRHTLQERPRRKAHRNEQPSFAGGEASVSNETLKYDPQAVQPRAWNQSPQPADRYDEGQTPQLTDHHDDGQNPQSAGRHDRQTPQPTDHHDDGQNPQSAGRHDRQSPQTVGHRDEGQSSLTADSYDRQSPQTADSYEGQSPQTADSYEGQSPQTADSYEGQSPQPADRRDEGQGFPYETAIPFAGEQQSQNKPPFLPNEPEGYADAASLENPVKEEEAANGLQKKNSHHALQTAKAFLGHTKERLAVIGSHWNHAAFGREEKHTDNPESQIEGNDAQTEKETETATGLQTKTSHVTLQTTKAFLGHAKEHLAGIGSHWKHAAFGREEKRTDNPESQIEGNDAQTEKEPETATGLQTKTSHDTLQTTKAFLGHAKEHLAGIGSHLKYTIFGHGEKHIVDSEEQIEGNSGYVKIESAENGFSEDIPAENRYAENIPAENRYAENIPAENGYAENIPAENSYAENAPTENRYAENIPAENSYAENVPAENRYAENVPAENSYAENVPTENRYVENVPTENRYVESVPAENRYAENAPVENVYAENVLAENSYAENSPVENSYAESVPVENVYAENVPAENSYAEKSSVENVYAENVPAENCYLESVPVENNFAGNIPEENGYDEDVPAENAFAENISAENGYAESYPAENGYVESISAENTLLENIPVENNRAADDSQENYSGEMAYPENAFFDNGNGKGTNDPSADDYIEKENAGKVTQEKHRSQKPLFASSTPWHKKSDFRNQTSHSSDPQDGSDPGMNDGASPSHSSPAKELMNHDMMTIKHAHGHRKNILRRKLVRDMTHSLRQFIAMMLLCFLGTWCFSGLDTTWRSMNLSFDKYFEENNAADLWVQASSYSSQDLDRISRIEGIKEYSVRTSIYVDCPELGNGDDVTAYLMAYDGEMKVNTPYLMEGELLDPSDTRGILLEEQFAKAQELEPGDSIVLEIDDVRSTYTVRGLVLSPEFIINEKDAAPDPETYGYVLLNHDAVKELPYTELCIVLEEDADETSVKSRLQELIPGCLIETKMTYDGTSFPLNLSEMYQALSYLFPILIYAIAMMIVVSTLKRMIENQRLQLGTLKALGFRKGKIKRHYLVYAIVPSVVGAFGGMIVGRYTLSKLLWALVLDTSCMPYVYYEQISEACWISVALMIALSVIVCGIVYRKTAAECAASLLRPKPPRSGSRLLLERWKGLWRRLSFNTKMVIRNLFRNKGRSFLSFVGVFCCNMLIISSFCMQDSIPALINDYYTGTHAYDVRANLDTDLADRLESYQSHIDAEVVEGVMELSVSLKSATETRACVLTVLTEDQTLYRLGKNQTLIAMPESGVCLTEKLCTLLEVSLGDTITFYLEGDKDAVTATINCICYTSLEQGMYMSKTAWLELRKGGFEPTALLFKGITEQAISELKDKDEIVGTLTFTAEQSAQTETVMDSTTTMFGVLAIAALALSFIICYNMGLMNFTERIRDYATLKVLGYHQGEIRSLMLREQMVIAFLATGLSVYPGMILTTVILKMCEYEEMVYDSYFYPKSILLACAISLGFACLVQLFLTRKVKGIDMVEALKSVE